jgi:hypothetical protein
MKTWLVFCCLNKMVLMINDSVFSGAIPQQEGPEIYCTGNSHVETLGRKDV